MCGAGTGEFISNLSTGLHAMEFAAIAARRPGK
jgi:hypothetical protein